MVSSGSRLTGEVLREIFTLSHFNIRQSKRDSGLGKKGDDPRKAALPSSEPELGLVAHMMQRQQTRYPGARLSSTLAHMVALRMPAILQEWQFPCVQANRYDKAFAGDWLNTRWVVVGTKCNSLLLLDTYSSDVTEVPLPPQPSRLQPQVPPGPYQNCGIHAIARSPLGDMLATGGHNPEDCQIFDIAEGPTCTSKPSLTARHTLVGHEDWLFGMAWVTNQHIVTGSRDRTLKLWSLSGEQGNKVISTPLVSRTDKRDKVRDVKFDQDIQRAASVVPSGKVSLWDSHLNFIRTMKLQGEKEVVCLAMKHDLVAVGSQHHVSLLDPRHRTPVTEIPNLDQQDVDAGVRSINMTETVLSYGTGSGRLVFHDLRNPKKAHVMLDGHGPVSKGGHFSSGATPPRDCLEAGSGWLEENDIYRNYFLHDPPGNAVYSHSWNPQRTRLLMVGGPLAYGLKGCYMGVWQ